MRGSDWGAVTIFAIFLLLLLVAVITGYLV